VAGFFLVLVVMITVICVREWILLIANKRQVALREAKPVWLPEYAVAEGKPLRLFGLLALGLALAKELTGEAHMDRARELAVECSGDGLAGVATEPAVGGKAGKSLTPAHLYVEVTERRFDGVNRCC
jgi:hypothetical protein